MQGWTRLNGQETPKMLQQQAGQVARAGPPVDREGVRRIRGYQRAEEPLQVRPLATTAQQGRKCLGIFGARPRESIDRAHRRSSLGDPVGEFTREVDATPGRQRH
jgi:hypothetical protein